MGSPEAASHAAFGSHDVASLTRVAAGSDAAGASHDLSFPTSDEILKRLNTYIKEYFVELGLNDLARQFLEEAEKGKGIPPLLFVETWVQLESKTLPGCAVPIYQEMEAMSSLNKGVEQYLKHLKIDTRCFNAAAWSYPDYGVRLIVFWMKRIYLEYKLLTAEESGNDAKIRRTD